MPDLDTQEKRRSAVAMTTYAFGPDVTPNATHDQEWRQEAGYGYPGILAAAPAAGPPAGSLLLMGVGI